MVIFTCFAILLIYLLKEFSFFFSNNLSHHQSVKNRAVHIICMFNDISEPIVFIHLKKLHLFNCLYDFFFEAYVLLWYYQLSRHILIWMWFEWLTHHQTFKVGITVCNAMTHSNFVGKHAIKIINIKLWFQFSTLSCSTQGD